MPKTLSAEAEPIAPDADGWTPPPEDLELPPEERKRREREAAAEARREIKLEGEIATLGELIDVLAETPIDLDDVLLQIEIEFPIRFELHYWKDGRGWRIRGW